MSETKWTDEQQQAIDTRKCNLLVAAAAGSGKTAVLVERIIKIITNEENPVDIDKLLVVTFTSAAAAEMRERVLNAIYKFGRYTLVNVDGKETTYTEDDFTFKYDTSTVLDDEKIISKRMADGTIYPTTTDSNGNEYAKEQVMEISASLNQSSVDKIINKIYKKYNVKATFFVVYNILRFH